MNTYMVLLLSCVGMAPIATYAMGDQNNLGAALLKATKGMSQEMEELNAWLNQSSSQAFLKQNYPVLRELITKKEIPAADLLINAMIPYSAKALEELKEYKHTHNLVYATFMVDDAIHTVEESHNALLEMSKIQL
ncbi:MAG: hypothetical protein WCE21_05040 [Candidatus Babeliales bacterium]